MSFQFLPPRRVRVPELTREQEAAAALGGGVRVVLGGPGTGKSVVAAAAAVRRVAAGSSLDRVIVLAHSRPAAQALRRDIARQVAGAQT